MMHRTRRSHTHPNGSPTPLRIARHICLIACSMMALAGCGAAETTKRPRPAAATETPVPMPRMVRKTVHRLPFAEGDELRAYLTINDATDQPIAMTISDDSATVTLTDLPLGDLKLQLHWQYRSAKFGDVPLTYAEKRIQLVEGNQQLSVTDSDYKAMIDSDNNGYDNLAELIADTNPFEFHDQPPRYTGMDMAGTDLRLPNSEARCVRDNLTGLIWELKTVDGGIQDRDNTYSWYNSDADTNGGYPGNADMGSCSAGSGCDTQSYVNDINAMALCGQPSWRLPERTELLSLVDPSASDPAIDSQTFIATRSAWYWTATAAANPVRVWIVSFANGFSDEAIKGAGVNRVRLVHSD